MEAKSPDAAHTIPIEEYAVIGDTETAALISRAGSIDWLCLPRFDSPSCFTALLGTREHGRWLLGPKGEARSTRRYRPGTSILETIHETPTGKVRVTDLMPVCDGRADLVRLVEGLEGEVEMEHEWIVRPDYGRVRPWVSHHEDEHGEPNTLVAVAGPDMLVLRGTRRPKGGNGMHHDQFPVRAGETHHFTLTWFDSWAEIPPSLDIDDRIRCTVEETRRWVEKCTYDGPYRDIVLRSMLVLRLLTDTMRGGIVAAVTTSLPEEIGGVRNWDYRFCWLRDASLTIEALLVGGFTGSMGLWRDWLTRALAGDPEDMQIMYAVDGSRHLTERELGYLPGYADSRPVRVGNAAVDQRQTDVLGEVMMAMQAARDAGAEESEHAWAVQRALIDNLAEHWQEPDNGLWEIRGPLRHFTHSRVMVWAAFDSGIAAIERQGLPGPVDKWRRIRDLVREEVLNKGFNEEMNSFVQHYDTTEVDASLLLIPLCGFLPADDPRVLGTIERIEKDLMSDGLLMRYRTEAGVDGLPGKEHQFLACSFWLVRAYAAVGRIDDARTLMDRLVGLANDVGLLSEEYDTDRKRLIGNFPQAFSHLTLVRAAIDIAAAEQAAEQAAAKQQEQQQEQQ